MCINLYLFMNFNYPSHTVQYSTVASDGRPEVGTRCNATNLLKVYLRFFQFPFGAAVQMYITVDLATAEPQNGICITQQISQVVLLPENLRAHLQLSV